MNTSPAVSASSPFDNPSRFGGRAPDIAGASSAPESPFDSQPMLALHDKLTSWYDAEWNRQASNRFQQALDEDFYDGMQWTQEDAQALIERGQAPLVFNEVKPTIDWIIGTERRTRVDYKILPREKDDEALAEIKTKLMKYVSDTNKLPWQRSMAFADAIKGGVGWLGGRVVRCSAACDVWSGIDCVGLGQWSCVRGRVLESVEWALRLPTLG